MKKLLLVLAVLFMCYVPYAQDIPLKTSTIIKRASLGDFQSTNIKFQRLLKLNELKTVKTYDWYLYIFPVVKIVLWISIIVLQYNFNYFE